MSVLFYIHVPSYRQILKLSPIQETELKRIRHCRFSKCINFMYIFRLATLIEMALRRVDIQRDRRGVHLRLENRLEEYGTRYVDHEITATAFLQDSGSLYGVRSTAQVQHDAQ